jgi:Zn-finger nucleic acid-binding protein
MNRQGERVVPMLFSERRMIRCPKCLVGMSLTTVAGISVEKCPSCEGTFFDKGEVESLLRKHLRFERFKIFRLLKWS